MKFFFTLPLYFMYKYIDTLFWEPISILTQSGYLYLEHIMIWGHHWVLLTQRFDFPYNSRTDQIGHHLWINFMQIYQFFTKLLTQKKMLVDWPLISISVFHIFNVQTYT